MGDLSGNLMPSATWVRRWTWWLAALAWRVVCGASAWMGATLTPALSQERERGMGWERVA